MKKTTKKVLVLFLALCMACNFLGCGTSDDNKTKTEPVTITVSQWHTMEEQFKEPFQQLVDAFEKENPNIKVEVESISWGDTLDQLTIRSNSKTAPDLMMLCSDWVAALGSMGALAELKPLVQPETIQALSWARASLLEPYEMNDALYGLTWYTFTFPLLYNRSALASAGFTPEQIPDTWTAFEDQLTEIAKSGTDVFAYTRDFTQGADGGRTFVPWLWAYGGSIFDEDGNICYDSPEAEAALKAMVDISHSGTPYPIGVGQYAAREVFAQNKICYMQESSWMRAILRDLSGKGESYDSEWGTANWPKSDVTGRRDTLVDAHVWGVSAYSEHPAEAAKFAEFLVTNRAAQELFLSVFGAITPIEEYADFPMYDDQYYETFIAAMEDGRALPFNAQINSVLTDMSVAMLDALNGTNPAEALRTAANASRATLGQTTK